jgi:hypothetical protein
MGQFTASPKTKFTGALLGALTVGALAAGGLGSAPTANATCASFFGFNSGGHCTSTPTSIAIAIGTNAQAHAAGLFGSAFAVGTGPSAVTEGAFTIATAIGDNAQAYGYGVVGMATTLGSNGLAETFGQGGSHTALGLNFALDVTLGSTVPIGSEAVAIGISNIAVNLFGNGTTFASDAAVANGNLNAAMTLGGTDNSVAAGLVTGTFNSAFSILGSGNTVHAGPGPVAIAGSIGQTGATITKQGPGVNINGFTAGGAAATPPAAHAKPAASGVGHPKSH